MHLSANFFLAFPTQYSEIRRSDIKIKIPIKRKIKQFFTAQLRLVRGRTELIKYPSHSYIQIHSDQGTGFVTMNQNYLLD